MMSKRAEDEGDLNNGGQLQTPEIRRGSSTIKEALEQPSRAMTRGPSTLLMNASNASLPGVPAKLGATSGATRFRACAACWVVDPHKSLWLSYWDLMTFLALFYTAIVTPVEVAFLKSPASEDRLTNGLFLANRAVDMIFILDMILQFRVAVRVTDSDGTRWLRTPEKIASNYVHSKWFYLDTFSISTSIFDLLPEGGATKDLIVLRAVRVLRLAKVRAPPPPLPLQRQGGHAPAGAGGHQRGLARCRHRLSSPPLGSPRGAHLLPPRHVARILCLSLVCVCPC